MTFREKVFQIVRSIPKGNVMTYRQVAEASGRPGAWRAVGNILTKNYDPLIPCHRVIRSDGTSGGYNRGEQKKRDLLRAEGVRAA